MIQKQLIIYGGCFDVPDKYIKIKRLQAESEKIDFWDDRTKAEAIIKELNDLKNEVEQLKQLKEELSSNIEMLEIADEPEMLKDISESSEKINNRVEAFSLLLLLNGPYDRNNCILDIHPIYSSDSGGGLFKYILQT